MVDVDTYRQAALALPVTSEQPHFHKTSIRMAKKIFATLDTISLLACIKLSPVDQDVFSSFKGNLFSPVRGKWGLQGWTYIDLTKVAKPVCIDALQCAYNQVIGRTGRS